MDTFTIKISAPGYFTGLEKETIVSYINQKVLTDFFKGCSAKLIKKVKPDDLLITYKIQEANDYIKVRADKEGLSENYLDGHGYEIDSNKTVYLINNKPVVFDLHDEPYLEKEQWYYVTRISDEWVPWKDVPKHNSKMKARF
jgi:hypothetical protein